MDSVREREQIDDGPLAAALAATRGKWKLMIVHRLAESPRQFGQLRQALAGISQKVLTEQLRELMAAQIVARERTGPTPAPVIYSLTDHGRRLVPIVEAIRGWGEGHIERVGGERVEAGALR